MLSTRKVLLLTILTLLVVLPPLALAHSPNQVAIGDIVQGELTTAAPSARYTLQGRAGDIVTITVTSIDFDAFLTLLNPSMVEVASDDDSAGGTDPQIDYVLPADGLYTIIVDSYNRISTGAFTLSVTGVPTFFSTPTPLFTPLPPSPTTPPPVETVGTIAPGQTVEGRLTGDQLRAGYAFEGRAGQRVTLTLTSDDFDAFLSLRDAAGVELAADDDRAGNLNARIEAFPLPADGTYVAVASSYNDASAGAFALTLEVARTEGQPTPTVSPTLTPSSTPVPTLEPPTASPTVERPTATPTVAPPTLTSTPEPAAATPTLTPTGEPLVVTQMLEIGQAARGALTREQFTAPYRFEGRAGQAVTITLTSDDFDAYLILRDPDGVEIVEDDDSAGGTDARIQDFTLPTDGVYTIVAGSYTNTGVGAFLLALEAGASQPIPATPTATFTPSSPEASPPPELTPPTATPTAGGVIEPGAVVEGRLTEGQPGAAYTFEGAAGDVVTITLTSGDFDPFLRLRDASGAELATDDDSGGSLNAQIAFFRLPASGVYTILVESYDGRVGAYSLRLSPATIRRIEYTQTVSDRLESEGQTAGYTFRGQGGDVVTIRLTSADFDSYLTLSRADTGENLISDDDSAGQRNALIGPYTLPDTGDYLILVRSYDNTGRGAYTLQLNQAVLTSISYGERIQTDIGDSNPALYYVFEASAGDRVSISVSSGGSVDTSLTLTDPMGFQVSFDDDGGPGFDPEILNQPLVADGAYTILVQTVIPDGAGRVTLTLMRDRPPSLDERPLTVTLNEKQPLVTAAFNGQAGQSVRLTARVLHSFLSGQTASPNIVVTQAGATLTTARGEDVSTLVAEFVVPQDGPVSVQISDYNYDRATLELTLERLAP